MRTKSSLLRDPLPLLIRFAVAAGLLFLLREDISRLYLAVMVPIVNGIFRLEGLAVEFIRQRHVLQLVYADLGFRFTVHDIIYQNLMVGVALFAATPGQSIRWKARWIGVVLGLLALTHVASLYLGGHVIVWDYVAALPDGERAQVARQVLEVFPRDRDWLYSNLFGLWHTWGRPTLALVVWLYAARDYLFLPEDGSRAAAAA